MFEWNDEEPKEVPESPAIVPPVDLLQTFPNTKCCFSNELTGGKLVYGVASELVYLGVHFTAWDDIFPSGVERTLWRASSIILIGLLLIYLLRFTTGNIFANSFARILGLQKGAHAMDISENEPLMYIHSPAAPTPPKTHLSFPTLVHDRPCNPSRRLIKTRSCLRNVERDLSSEITPLALADKHVIRLGNGLVSA
ncbi:hypothetical protein BJ170DRAFT_728889 [Xylariales sp. AK1849]|nr:hypothetical protein BJ170DRAFT_728889 [Xylariales sp. AK1849]